MSTEDPTIPRATLTERYQPDLVQMLRVYDTGDPGIPRDYARLPLLRWWQRCDRCVAWRSALILALLLALTYLARAAQEFGL